MRSDDIKFADLTKIYNKLYFPKCKTLNVQQTVISRKSRKIIKKIYDERFLEYLEKNSLESEKSFFVIQ